VRTVGRAVTTTGPPQFQQVGVVLACSWASWPATSHGRQVQLTSIRLSTGRSLLRCFVVGSAGTRNARDTYPARDDFSPLARRNRIPVRRPAGTEEWMTDPPPQIQRHEATDRFGKAAMRTAHDLGEALADRDPVVVRTDGPHRSLAALAALIDDALIDDALAEAGPAENGSAGEHGADDDEAGSHRS